MKRGAILLPLVVASCATTPTQWYSNGRTQAQFNAAHIRCENYAADAMDQESLSIAGRGMASGGRGAAAGGALAGLAMLGSEGEYLRCMEAHGFTRAR